MRDRDSIKWYPIATVDKFDRDQVAYVRRKTGLLEPEHAALLSYTKPYESVTVEGNLLTTAGLNRLTSLVIGAGGQALSATAVRLGVGDDTTAAAVGDTDLSTGTNQYYRVMDATYPQQSNGVMTFKASFQDADANFAWQCWGVDVGTPTVTSGGTVNALLFNRKVASLGTKASGVWVLTATITLS